MRSALVGLFVATACSRGSSPQVSNPGSSGSSGSAADAPIVKATSCTPGEMTYLGFRGDGQPAPALLREIRARFPDAIVVEVGAGTLGVVIAEPHSMEVRARHEAAAAAVGWLGDVVDFPSVGADCSLAFHTPPPPPAPHAPPAGRPTFRIPNSGEFKLPADWVACTRDNDCTIVSLGCCDETPVARAHAAALREALDASGRRYCPPKSACGPSRHGTWDGEPGRCTANACVMPQ
jgi:hypothetical protein